MYEAPEVLALGEAHASNSIERAGEFKVGRPGRFALIPSHLDDQAILFDCDVVMFRPDPRDRGFENGVR